MTRIAFFGHDAGDAAVRRRARAFLEDGFGVTGFMMRRGALKPTEWQMIDLGETRDGAFLQRIRQVFRGARVAASEGSGLASADVIYARNLDMLACAFLAKRHAGLKTPVVYECLDVHRLLCRKDPVGSLLRRLEGWLMNRSAALIVSSPGFVKHHFERHYRRLPPIFLIENRLAGGQTYGGRKAEGKGALPGRLRIGWVGNLRCRRSLDLLCALADELGDAVDIRLHGVPARTEIPVFEPLIDARPNMSYHGRYRSPEDLQTIYDGLDVVWAGDFMEAGLNSVWLLPNRIYEGGYFCTPAIAPEGTETGAWITRHASGFTLAEPLEETLPALARSLLANPDPIGQRARALARLPDETFVQPRGFLRSILSGILASPEPVAEKVCA
ncbi:MAG: glycosyl transferase [Hyphomonas sp.]